MTYPNLLTSLIEGTDLEEDEWYAQNQIEWFMNRVGIEHHTVQQGPNHAA